MKTKTINLNGFTLMELLLVLIILSLIVSMGLLVMNIVRTNFNTLDSNNTNLIGIQNSDMELNSFFFNSDTVFYNSESKILSSSKGNSYAIKEGFILDVQKDKISMDSIYDIQLNFYSNDKNKQIVNLFSFSKKHDAQLFSFSYSKLYDIATRIKYPITKSLAIK